ncbi:MAG: SUMF1/EgtB/PvdO family nonheme iron enzyme, partial [Phycisphaerae bacterium]
LQGPAQGSCRVLRGGCWSYESRSLRAAERMQQPPTQRLNLIGFRLVLNADNAT